MTVPVAYDHGVALEFGGCAPAKPFDASPAVILPVPLERTISYVPGTRNAPHDILLASSHLELWDEEVDLDAHAQGIFTLPEMELPVGEMAEAMAEITRVATSLAATGKFLVTLGGEHSITPAVVAAFAARHAGLSVLQIDAHADLRDAFMGSRFNHACAMRRVLETCTVYAGRDSKSVDRRKPGDPEPGDADLLRLRHAAGSNVDRSRGRHAERERVCHDRL